MSGTCLGFAIFAVIAVFLLKSSLACSGVDRAPA